MEALRAKKIFYLDTSAINNLYDDPSLPSVKIAIQDKAQVYISVFTVAELSATANAVRREGLLKLAKEISGPYRPAAMAGDLLRRSLEAINVCALEIDHSMGREWDGVWIALNNPKLIDAEAYQEITTWKQQQESWYQDMHNQGRPLMQCAIVKLSREEICALTSRFSRFFRNYLPDREFVTNIVLDMASHCGTKILVDRALAQRIIKHSEHWRFFLASMAYGMYVRSIKHSHFLKKQNPGSIDTQQAIYLTICDVFVTADQQQYQMMRLLAPFGHKKRQVWNYPKFAFWLLN